MKKRLLSLALAVTMVASTLILGSCDGSGDSGKTIKGARTTRDLTNVYKAEAINTVGTTFEKLRISNVYALNDGKLLVWGYTEDDYEDKYYITDPSFQNASELVLPKAEGENTETYMQNLVSDSKTGNIWYIKNVYTYSEANDDTTVMPRETAVAEAIDAEKYYINVAIDDDFAVTPVGESSNRYYLVEMGADGNVIAEREITSDMTITEEDGTTYTGYISSAALVNGMYTFSVGNKFLSFADGAGDPKVVEVADEGGSVQVESMYVGTTGKVYYSTWGENGMELSTIDLETGVSAKTDFGDLENEFYNYNISASGPEGFEFVMNNEFGIYGYTPGDASLTEICSFTNSDIDMGYSYGSNPIFLDDGRILMSYYDYDENANNILLLSKVDPSMVKEKYLITVGARYINYNLRKAFMKFNRTSEDYKVIFKDYSIYDNESNDYNGSIEQLNKDILSKTDAPDIVLIQYGMDITSLANKGIFVDLEKLMASDETFNKSDYMENVFEALKLGGKLYSISPSVSFMTLVGKKSIFGDKNSWTMKDFLEMHRSLGEGENMISEATRDGIGTMLLQIAVDEFIGDDGKANFDSEEFKNLLAYLKDIPADYTAYEDLWLDNHNYWEESELGYSKGTTKLFTGFIPGFNQIPEFEAYLGEEVTLIGYPTGMEGTIGTLIQANQELAITSSTKVMDGCWEVFKYLLGDEYQNKFAGDADEYGHTGSYQFPIKKTMVEKKMKNDILPSYYTEKDENGNEVQVKEDNMAWIGGTEVPKRDSTEADAARIYELISGASVCQRENEELNKIILDEAQAYFDGQKTVEEVVPIINSRVQILINQ